jgi:hypothetical protein
VRHDFLGTYSGKKEKRTELIVCIRRGCRRVCEVSVIDLTFPIGCIDQCNTSNDCNRNQLCARRECGNICVVKRKSNSYQH